METKKKKKKYKKKTKKKKDHIKVHSQKFKTSSLVNNA